MKTRLFALAAIAFVFAACEKNDIEKQNGEGSVAAEIHASISDAVLTRVSGTEWTTDDCIGISENRFNQTNIPHTFDGQSFQPAGSAIYFKGAEDATFSAYYPYDEAGGILEASTDGDNQSLKIDFLFASGATANSQNPQVNFINENAEGETDPTKDHSFHHCMSQISVTFQEGVAVDFETEGITDFSFTNLKLEGSFNTATGEAKADEEATVSPLTVDLSGATLTEGQVSASAICFPQEVSEIELSVTVNGVDYHATLSLPDADQNGVPDQALLPGYNYTYNIIVNKTSLQAGTCTIQPWNDAGRYQNEATNTGYDYDQETHTYLVYNLDGLYAWANAVQNDMTLNCTVLNTIILPDVPQGESNWTPIGSVDNPYRGTFDAMFSPIQNMTIYAPDEDYVGMFRVVSEEGSVWAQLFDVDIIGQNYVGFVGLNNGTVKCYLSGSVTGKQYVGGFTGYNNNQVKTVNGLNITYPAGGARMFPATNMSAV